MKENMKKVIDYLEKDKFLQDFILEIKESEVNYNVELKIKQGKITDKYYKLKTLKK